jgi:hypothetical protein
MLDQPISVLLSREEVMAVLALLNVASIPGLVSDPVGQAAAALSGERALRARELARIGADGRVQVHRDVLELVGACGYAQGSLIVTHLADRVVRSCFGHRRGDTFVLHTSPEAGLHRFEGAPDRAALVDALVAFSGWTDAPQSSLGPLAVSRAALDRARAAVRAQSPATAVVALSGDNVPAESAERLAYLLGQPYELTVVQAVQPRGTDSAAVQTLSVLRAGTLQWLMVEPEPGPAAAEMYVLQPAAQFRVAAAVSGLAW